MTTNFQVVLEWGAAGLRNTEADVTVIVATDDTVDARELRSLAVTEAGPALELTEPDEAREVAQRILNRQVEAGRRLSIRIIAAGTQWPDGSARFSVADHLTAGALVDALCDLGIDFRSPACAIASAAFVELRGAVRHLMSAARDARE